jgi:hypothetical protein
VARGAATALVTAMPTYDKNGHQQASVIQTIAIRGDGASIQTGQWISQSITSTGPLGDLLLQSNQGITDVTAPSIFGSVVSGGPIIGTIQTTGVRTDPITSATSLIPANFGNVYVDFYKKDQSLIPFLTTTVIQAKGPGLSGRVISRGNLVSQMTVDGGISGVVAVQGDLGLNIMVGQKSARLASIVSNGGLSGSIVVLGRQLGDVTLHGLTTGSYAVKGGILGNLNMDGGLALGAKVVSGGQIGDATLGTFFDFTGSNKGIIAAKGNILFDKTAPKGYVFNNVGATANPNGAGIDTIFNNNNIPLALDLSGLDLQGLALMLLDLGNLTVSSSGNLTFATQSN